NRPLYFVFESDLDVSEKEDLTTASTGLVGKVAKGLQNMVTHAASKHVRLRSLHLIANADGGTSEVVIYDEEQHPSFRPFRCEATCDFYQNIYVCDYRGGSSFGPQSKPERMVSRIIAEERGWVPIRRKLSMDRKLLTQCMKRWNQVRRWQIAWVYGPAIRIIDQVLEDHAYGTFTESKKGTSLEFRPIVIGRQTGDTQYVLEYKSEFDTSPSMYRFNTESKDELVRNLVAYYGKHSEHPFKLDFQTLDGTFSIHSIEFPTDD